MSDVYQDSVALHKKHQGKLGVQSRVTVTNRAELSLAYTPGVAEPCRIIAQDVSASFDLTWRGRTVAVVSDGSAVLGLGNIGPEASLPVMEGKALLMREFAGVDAIPLVVGSQETQDIIKFVKLAAPGFAGVNLEDISAPRCFEVEEALQDIGIPVFHDDQHGTAIVVTAALHNAAKVVGKPFDSLTVVIVGAGAAGLATARMLLGRETVGIDPKVVAGADSVKDLIVVDSIGALSLDRTDLNGYKKAMAQVSNKHKKSGSLSQVIQRADVVIGVSGPNTISKEMVQSMAPKAIVFAMANPTPEIMPELAQASGAAVVATGRSDFPNQINNVLAFPGIFKAVIDGRLTQITTQMKLAAAKAIAELVQKPNHENIVPDPFTPNLAAVVAQAILDTKKQ